MDDLFSVLPEAIAQRYANQFTAEFLAYLPANLHVFAAFEREALKVARLGFKHYSARTIVEVLRHHSALEQVGGQWKLNDHNTPYLARLFALVHPAYSGLFEFREAKAIKREECATP